MTAQHLGASEYHVKIAVIAVVRNSPPRHCGSALKIAEVREIHSTDGDDEYVQRIELQRRRGLRRRLRVSMLHSTQYAEPGMTRRCTRVQHQGTAQMLVRFSKVPEVHVNVSERTVRLG